MGVSHKNLGILQRALGQDAGLVAVGGCVRDRLLGRDGGDLDLATPLMPESVIKRARGSRLAAIRTGLAHGTVTIVVDGCGFEITTFRSDGDYLDGRRPSSVRLGVSLEEDLSRRDFTVNAMALPIEFFDSDDWRPHIIDPFGGLLDLEREVIRAVGDPLQRFQEDGLRPYRACRFVAQLGFTIEASTGKAITQRLEVASGVAVERVFTELSKLLTGPYARAGLASLAEHGLLDLCLPESVPSIGCGQNSHHAHDVWKHTLEVVGSSPADAAMRWAALLHDVGKPTAKFVDDAGSARFHGHEAIGVAMALKIFKRLKAPNALQDEALALIKHHGTRPDGTWTDSACRRFLRRLAEDGLDWRRWAELQLADQTGKGLEDEHIPTAHSELCRRVEAIAKTDPVMNVKALAIDGVTIMGIARRRSGPWIGTLKKYLLEAVTDDPSLNTEESLDRLVKDWLKL